jgi:hypothetical protein
VHDVFDDWPAEQKILAAKNFYEQTRLAEPGSLNRCLKTKTPSPKPVFSPEEKAKYPRQIQEALSSRASPKAPSTPTPQAAKKAVKEKARRAGSLSMSSKDKSSKKHTSSSNEFEDDVSELTSKIKEFEGFE